MITLVSIVLVLSILVTIYWLALVILISVVLLLVVFLLHVLRHFILLFRAIVLLFISILLAFIAVFSVLTFLHFHALTIFVVVALSFTILTLLLLVLRGHLLGRRVVFRGRDVLALLWVVELIHSALYKQIFKLVRIIDMKRSNQLYTSLLCCAIFSVLIPLTSSRALKYM